MPKILVTKIETFWKDSDTTIKLYGRDENNDLHIVDVYGFRPYFYAAADEVRGREKELKQQEVIQELDDSGYRAYTGEPVVRIYTPTPRDVVEARAMFKRTYEADVQFTNRFRIDCEVVSWIEYEESPCHYSEIEPVDPPESGDPDLRITTLDIEVDDRFGFPEDGEQRILSIVAYDSYEREFVGFLNLEGRPIEEAFDPDGPVEGLEDLGIEELDKLVFEPDERRMLISFACWVEEHDPDLLTAWNVDFDIPYLIQRMKRIGVAPSRLSREEDAFVRNNGTPIVKGRSVYDMLDAYRANTWGELKSYKLDDIAADVLGERKVAHGGSVYDLWADDPAKLLNYNGRDVRLVEEINEKEMVVEFRDALRKQVGVDFEDTMKASDFAEMSARRKLREKGVVGPTSSYQPKDHKYEGAVVFKPYTGVAENVVGMDLASLYPMTMWMLNSSPEMKIQPESDGYDGSYSRAPNGVCFCQDRDGLFRELVDDALELKNHYKELRNNADTPEEESYWSIRYDVAKTITNSYYGVIGWERFFLYDEETAEAITTMGQAVIKETQRFISEETPGEVIYGDTDSNYVRFPRSWEKERCIEKATSYARELNDIVYPHLAADWCPGVECKWEIEVEVFIERFFQAGKKKRYAYLATWKNGHDIEPKVTIKGFDSQRSDTAVLTEELQETVLKKILRGASSEDLGQFVYEAAKEIDPEDPDWERIGIPGGFGKHIHENCDCGECYAWSSRGSYPKDAHPRGAYFANKLMGTNFDKGSKPMRVYLQPFHAEGIGEVDVICFDDPEELPSEARVDVGRMTKTLVVRPLSQILEAVDVDVEAAVRGQLQTGLRQFM